MKQIALNLPSGAVALVNYEYEWVIYTDEMKDLKKRLEGLTKYEPIPDDFWEGMRENYYVYPVPESVEFLKSSYKKKALKVSTKDLEFLSGLKYHLPVKEYSLKDIKEYAHDFVNPD